MNFKMCDHIGWGFKTSKMNVEKRRWDDGPHGVGRAVKPVRPSPSFFSVAMAIPKKTTEKDLRKEVAIIYYHGQTSRNR